MINAWYHHRIAFRTFSLNGLAIDFRYAWITSQPGRLACVCVYAFNKVHIQWLLFSLNNWITSTTTTTTMEIALINHWKNMISRVCHEIVIMFKKNQLHLLGPSLKPLLTTSIFHVKFWLSFVIVFFKENRHIACCDPNNIQISLHVFELLLIQNMHRRHLSVIYKIHFANLIALVL